MKLQALYKAQKEYEEYPLTVFCKHIYQSKKKNISNSLPSVLLIPRLVRRTRRKEPEQA
jgi:hypothetical protein